MNHAEPRRVLHQGRKLAALLSLLLAVALAPASPLAVGNPIVVENQQPGSGSWMWTKLADDTAQQIKGYASATSVNQNQDITFYVSVNPVQSYTIDFFRFGYYGGTGARLRLHAGPLSGFQQAVCPMDATTGMIACNWTPSYTLTVPSDWTSGVYGALLTNDQGFQNYVMFVVKDGRPAPFLYQQSVTTDQAYNDYPNDGRTGKSLYDWNSDGATTASGTKAAVKVSFDRPQADSGMGQFYRWEMDFIRWVEHSGYDVTYSTDIDTHANGGELLNHRAFLSVGHDEYWTKEMRDAVEFARDSGVSLGFFGANASYTQIRLESSGAGVPNRVVVEYRDFPWLNPHPDPVQGPTTTGDFRWLGRPEQTMIGVQFNFSSPQVDYVVTNSSHWVYAGTGFSDGDHVAGIVGYEADSFMTTYPPPNTSNQTLLSASPYTDPGGTTFTANSSIYQAPSGAWVFAAGTLSWAWALEDAPGILQQFKVNPKIQQTTANVLNAFLTGVPGGGPTITGFTPTSGAAGTNVTISGTNFTGATAVAFNGMGATTFTVTSATTIQATVPAGATTGPITVTTPGGTATSASAFTVTASGPTITGFTPTSGPVGSTVTITGTSFTGATAVAFNGIGATTFTVTSATTIQATVPAGATTGPITVTTPGGTATSASAFTVTASGPTITGFSPTSGPAGSTVTITGTSFTGATAVAFNGIGATTFTVTSATTIQATVPAGATTGTLSVTTPNGTATSASAFTVTASGPTITSFSPTSGPVGSTVTITGTSFTGATAVTFNGTSAPTFTVTSATTIQATVPAGATTGTLSVTTPGGTATSASAFTVTASGPTVTSFSPTSGPVGSTVTITGTSFTGATTVTFNGTSATTFTVTSATTIQATVPAGSTTGPIGVTTPNGTATSASNFTVTASGPTITSFSPTSGPVGSTVSITGTSFTGATAVAFNGTSATTFTVTSATTIQATVPAGATTGPISVTTPGGTATSASAFTVTASGPTITGFSPTSGPAGSSVTISGTSFTGATAVTFNGTAAIFSVTSNTVIQATVPAGATTGPVRVTTSAGTATSASNFTVVNPPTITGFTPTSGPAGSSVTINGTSFTGATAVTFNGTAAIFSVTSNTVIQATVPAGATTGPVRVTTSAGTATSASNFTVVNPPTITGFTPTSGPAGSSVTINGTSFTGATAVTFNGTGTSFTVTSATTIQATVPAGATTGRLAVTTPAGTATSATNFTVVPPPTITSFSPTSGLVGVNVTITGTSFTGATAVTFNGIGATTFSVISATSIQATVPAGATTGRLSVTTAGGTASSASNFTVLIPPTITSFTPASGAAGASVTINGTNFTGVTAVRFNGTGAGFTVTSATTIQTTVPAGATTGLLSVTTSGGTAISPSNFTVRVALTVSKTHGLLGVSNGTVTSSPAGINCGGTCSAFYNMGATITLIATPDLLSLFGGWDGCDSVSGTSCTVTMSNARGVVANFLP